MSREYAYFFTKYLDTDKEYPPYVDVDLYPLIQEFSYELYGKLIFSNSTQKEYTELLNKLQILRLSANQGTKCERYEYIKPDTLRVFGAPRHSKGYRPQPDGSTYPYEEKVWDFVIFYTTKILALSSTGDEYGQAFISTTQGLQELDGFF